MSDQEAAANPFEDVDASDDPNKSVRYLDAVRAEARATDHKHMTLEMMRLSEGDAGLDVGCGTGEDVIAIARMVGPKGHAAGVDLSETMVAEARKRAAADGVVADFRCTDGSTLPFSSATFHAVRIERVLIHAESPAAVLAEMVRVTRPGGRVVALETDFGSLIDAPHREIRRKLAVWIEDKRIRNGWMGRQLWRLFRETRLVDVEVRPLATTITGDPPAYYKEQTQEWVNGATAAGALTPGEAQVYERWLAEAYASGDFFASRVMFAAVGTVRA